MCRGLDWVFELLEEAHLATLAAAYSACQQALHASHHRSPHVPTASRAKRSGATCTAAMRSQADQWVGLPYEFDAAHAL